MSTFSIKALTGALGLAVACLAATPVSAETTKEKILREHKLTAGIHNQAPWAARQPDGSVVGYHADVIRAVFEPLGVKEFVFVTGEFGSLIPGLVAGRFDLVNSGVVIKPERCKLVAFSNPDLATGDGMLVKKGNPHNLHSYADLKAKPNVRVGASRGSAQGKNAATGASDEQLNLFQNTETTLAAIMSGRVDAVVFTSGTAGALLAKPGVDRVLERARPFTGLTGPDGKELKDPLGTAFRLDDKDLVELYNQQLAKLKADGTLAKLMEKHGFAADEAAPEKTAADICAGK